MEDAEIKKLKDLVNQRVDFETHRLALKERNSEELSLAYNGGLFKVTPELIAFLATWEDKVKLHIEDSYGNPIEVDRVHLLQKLRERYSAVMNSWHTEFQQLKSARKVKDL